MRDLDLSALKRAYPVSLLFTGCMFFIASAALSLNVGLGVLYGSLFGVVNTWLISLLARYAFDPRKRNPTLAAIAFVIKLPVVYGLLIFAFLRGWFHPVGFLLGFVLFFATVLTYLCLANLGFQVIGIGREDDAR